MIELLSLIIGLSIGFVIVFFNNNNPDNFIIRVLLIIGILIIWVGIGIIVNACR